MATAYDPDHARNPPRDFAAYDPTEHFDSRVACDRRPVNRSLAVAAVEYGAVEGNPVDRDVDEWRFRRRLDGIDVVVPAGISKHDGVTPRVFTAYADVADARIAIQSGTWSRRDVHTAALLQYLQDERPVVDGHLHPRRIHVTDPIRYRGHLIVNKEGYERAFCLRCKLKSDDADRFDDCRCH